MIGLCLLTQRIAGFCIVYWCTRTLEWMILGDVIMCVAVPLAYAYRLPIVWAIWPAYICWSYGTVARRPHTNAYSPWVVALGNVRCRRSQPEPETKVE